MLLILFLLTAKIHCGPNSHEEFTENFDEEQEERIRWVMGFHNLGKKVQNEYHFMVSCIGETLYRSVPPVTGLKGA